MNGRTPTNDSFDGTVADPLVCIVHLRLALADMTSISFYTTQFQNLPILYCA